MSILGPEQIEYPHHPSEALGQVAQQAADQLGVMVENLRLPEKRGDRTARFDGRTPAGDLIFVKILGTSHEDTGRLFRHEVAVLGALNDAPLEVFSVPHLIDHGRVQRIDWMALEYVEGDRVLLTDDSYEPLVRALKAVRAIRPAIITAHPCEVSHDPRGINRYRQHLEEVVPRLERLTYIMPQQRDIIMRFADHAIPQLSDYEPLTSHGDFAPNNLRLRRESLWVLDWEHSHLNYGPIDLAHYVTTRHVWRSELKERLIKAVVEDWEMDREVFMLAEVERLTGRANDTYQRRGQRDQAALEMLGELVEELGRFLNNRSRSVL